MSIIVAYGITTLAAFVLAISYGALVKKKELWLMLLFISVVIVNFGYFSLSVSKTLSEALLANRVSYLGSVFLPLCMLMTIRNVCHVKNKQWNLIALIIISFLIFLVTATPGYTNWYYRDVSLQLVQGSATLETIYGPLHWLYYIYLLAYFGMMIGVIVASGVKKQNGYKKQSLILLFIVFLNIVIWLIEQWVEWKFELLSISYIVSELALLILYQRNQTNNEEEAVPTQSVAENLVIDADEVLSQWEAVSL